jgi:hypothetical protein
MSFSVIIMHLMNIYRWVNILHAIVYFLFFTICIIDLYMQGFLRKPNFNDIQNLYATHKRVMGFLECLKALILCIGNGLTV